MFKKKKKRVLFGKHLSLFIVPMSHRRLGLEIGVVGRGYKKTGDMTQHDSFINTPIHVQQ